METITAKSNARLALGVFGRTIVAALIGVILYLSLSTIFATFSTEKIGVTVWEYDSSGVAHEVKTYLYEDKDFPDELKLEENQTSTDKYSPVPAGVELALDIVTQVCNLIILAAFPYRKLWAQGDHDRNEINFGHLKEDTQRGLKVGLIADIPAILVYLSLWLGKLGVPLFEHTHALYTLFNSSFLPFCYRTMGRGLQSATGLSVGSMLALLLPVVFLTLVCHVAYTLGLHQFSVSDKLFYKNKPRKKKTSPRR